MPQVSEFYGISIYMYYEDHNPAHFHAIYGEYKALIDIENGTIMKGYLPTRQYRLVLAWCEIHREELLDNWFLSKSSGGILSIEPLR